MARVPRVKNLTTLTKGFRDDLERRAGITNWGYDSAVRSVTDVLTAELYLTQNSIRRVAADLQVESARGKALAKLGEMYGIQRLHPTYAAVDWTERSLMFYVDSTFGDINGGAAFTIPAGTEITVSNAEGDVTIRYTTAADYTAPAGASYVYCSAVASTLGSGHNVAAYTLVNHGFTGYTDSVNSTLKVSNVYPILNGRDLESDDNLRFRISNMFGTLATTNATSINLRSISVPGVLKAKPLPGYYGIGTCAVVVFGAGGESNMDLAKRTQERLNVLQVAGMQLIAIPGMNVQFDLVMDLYVGEGVTSSDKKSIKREIRRATNRFFSGQGTGTNVVDFSRLKRSIIRNVTGISGILDRRARANLFNSIYVRRIVAGSTSERSLLLTTSYTLEEEEYATLGSLEVTFVERA
tara:strand:+ start:331 stop:1560 length:1230 start_codon:yes stop_codon:yes gene_type:complete